MTEKKVPDNISSPPSLVSFDDDLDVNTGYSPTYVSYFILSAFLLGIFVGFNL